MASAAGIAAVRHRAVAVGHWVPGGILIGNAAAYDSLSRRLHASLHGPIAADAAAVARDGPRVLEVVCGPGYPSIRLGRQHGLDVIAGDVAPLPFPDGSFDLVVSTLSMHHRSDVPAGLSEIGRVLQPGGRALK